MRFAVDDLPEVFGCVLLVCDLPAEKVAGLRWVREGIGRIDLPGESLIQRRHRVGPVEAKQLRACHGHRRLSPDSVFFFVFFCALASPCVLKENRRQAAGSLHRAKSKI